ncbi:WYL domain-containing protein [Geobacter pelophilus]|uniref:WYL domain-containing protein n=1 Tax=Geoanaerobacter pelophilus TaxID=60036 RepID=A0AAW4L9I3_9BACT|nr:WYL domain-containing protein [Geoanaerobacter pelophilus]MBT0664507.1 WYL domain-containing protein [Geoanaerobacter pelophilus]
MSALYRQWLILKMFPPRGKISTTTILNRLINEYGIEASLRTIQRDLVSLELNKFPLDCDGENPAGWSWRKDAPAFGISNMDPVSVLTFKLAEEHLGRMFPLGAMAGLEPYFRAANEKSKLTSESSFSRWPDKIKVASRNLPMIYPRIANDIMDKVYTAVLEERRFKAQYRNVNVRVKEHTVNPLGMAFVDGLTYLIATLNEHDNPRLLLLHRFLAVTLTEIPATVPDGFDLNEYTSRELSFPVGDNIKLKALFYDETDIKRLRETPIAVDQKIVERNEGWQLQATISDSYQLRWWLRGYGERAEVLGPKSLRQEFAEVAIATAKRYMRAK